MGPRRSRAACCFSSAHRSPHSPLRSPLAPQDGVHYHFTTHEAMEADIGACPPTGDLRFWADQGVLLLNTVLTVPAGAPQGHRGTGWETLTEQILARLADAPRAYLLWGAHAQKAARRVDAKRNLKIETAHPSTLSARRGFFGSSPFSRVNGWLQDRTMPAINWTHPPQAGR